MSLSGLGVPRELLAPVLYAATQMWSRPSQAAVFPLVPAGVLNLYARSQAVLDEAGIKKRVKDESRSRLEELCLLYAVGYTSPACRSVSRSIAVENGDRRPPGSSAGSPALAQAA